MVTEIDIREIIAIIASHAHQLESDSYKQTCLAESAKIKILFDECLKDKKIFAGAAIQMGIDMICGAAKEARKGQNNTNPNAN